MGSVLDLDSFEKNVEVKYKGKVYKLRKIREAEKGLFEEVMKATQTNDMSIYDKVMDFVINRFKEVDSNFPADDFKNEVTLDMLNAIFGVLAGADVEIKKK